MCTKVHERQMCVGMNNLFLWYEMAAVTRFMDISRVSNELYRGKQGGSLVKTGLGK